jgi:hypothetical protein
MKLKHTHAIREEIRMIQIISKHCVAVLANDFKSLRVHSGRTRGISCVPLCQKKYNFVYVLDEES